MSKDYSEILANIAHGGVTYDELEAIGELIAEHEANEATKPNEITEEDVKEFKKFLESAYPKLPSMSWNALKVGNKLIAHYQASQNTTSEVTKEEYPEVLSVSKSKEQWASYLCRSGRGGKDEVVYIREDTINQASQTEWVSVDDRLPEYSENVLVSEGTNIGHASLRNSCIPYWNIVASNDRVPMSDVTHWMPLPATPPKREE